jgi:hypothetical protein
MRIEKKVAYINLINDSNVFIKMNLLNYKNEKSPKYQIQATLHFKNIVAVDR